MSFNFDSGSGALTVASDAGDDLVLGCSAGTVTLNLAALAGPVSCAAVVSATANGGPGVNLISFAAVNAPDFTLLSSVAINGGDGGDTIVGSFLADVIHGDGGNDFLDGSDNPVGSVDQVFGDDGDDTMTWNPGKDDDLNEGGPGFDTSVIIGGGAAETFTITPDPVSVGRVRLARSNPAPFFVDIGTTERLIVNANGGDDSITGSAGLNGLIALELNGGDNNDTIVGGDGADIIHGGNGNDLLDGSDNPVGSVDQVFGDDGDDTMTWNPGKDDDLNEGGPGFDTSVIVGGGAAETFTITPDPVSVGRVRLARSNPAPFFVDIGTTERLIVNANGGDDSITGSAGLNGLIALELNGGDNNDTIVGGDGADIIHGGNGNDLLDGSDNPVGSVDQVFGDDGDDTMTWNPGKDDDLNEGGPGFDTSVIVGGGAAETFTIAPDAVNISRVRLARSNPAPFFVDIGTTERLIVNANGGNDFISGSAGLNGLIALELNGGDGNDTITGGDGPDLIHGGNDDDTLDGSDNPASTLDQVFGDDGNDLMIWNPGKDDDLNEGGAGFDTTVINGGPAGEVFLITQAGARVRFERTNNAPAPFFVDIGSTERLQLNAEAGSDQVTTLPLRSTEQVLDGGTQATPTGDQLFIVGFSGNLQNSPIAIPGFGLIAHTGFEFAADAGPAQTFSASLEGGQEEPPVDTTGTGRGSVSLNAAEDEISVLLAFNNLGGNNTMTHIHGPAAPGVNAGVLFNLGNSGANSGNLGPLVFAVNAQQVADLKAGLWYFNVHSTSDPTGEIRGQILPDRVIEAYLDGGQQVPRVSGTASGFGTVTLAGPEDSITVTLNYIGLAGDNTLTRISGPAPRGQNGAEIFSLAVSGNSSATLTSAPIAVSAAEVAQLKRGDWYFDVQSSAHPNGELRGQIDNAQFRDGFE